MSSTTTITLYTIYRNPLSSTYFPYATSFPYPTRGTTTTTSNNNTNNESSNNDTPAPSDDRTSFILICVSCSLVILSVLAAGIYFYRYRVKQLREQEMKTVDVLGLTHKDVHPQNKAVRSPASVESAERELPIPESAVVVDRKRKKVLRRVEFSSSSAAAKEREDENEEQGKTELAHTQSEVTVEDVERGMEEDRRRYQELDSLSKSLLSDRRQPQHRPSLLQRCLQAQSGGLGKAVPRQPQQYYHQQGQEPGTSTMARKPWHLPSFGEDLLRRVDRTLSKGSGKDTMPSSFSSSSSSSTLSPRRDRSGKKRMLSTLRGTDDDMPPLPLPLSPAETPQLPSPPVRPYRIRIGGNGFYCRTPDSSFPAITSSTSPHGPYLSPAIMDSPTHPWHMGGGGVITSTTTGGSTSSASSLSPPFAADATHLAPTVSKRTVHACIPSVDYSQDEPAMDYY